MRFTKMLTLGLVALICVGIGASTPSVAAGKKTAYLFAYFTGNGEDGLHLAWSADGLAWTSLNDGKSYIKPCVGESKLMRDPYLMYCPDGVFRMVWTSAWKGVTIGYASSKDLINWSEQVALPVGEVDRTENCWAPEMAYDKATKNYIIFWSSTIKGRFTETDNGGDMNHRTYCTTTRDFGTFTATKLFFDPGFNCIDPTMLKYGKKYLLIFKDERRKPEAKKNLRIVQGNSPVGPWTDLTEPFTKQWVEGPTCLKVGDEYIIYYDCFTAGHYGALKTRDFVNWEDVTSKISIPAGARHGSMLEVSMKVIEKLTGQKG